MDWPPPTGSPELTVLSIANPNRNMCGRQSFGSCAARARLAEMHASNSQPGSSYHQLRYDELVVLSSWFEILIPCMPEETQASDQS